MSHLDLHRLPDIVIENIFSYLSYDEIARFRMTCKSLDSVCKKLLNKGFIAAERFHSQSIKAVKVQLPRRESERRLHPMARHCDILTAIETRLSMLSMTYMKYVDVGLCCFIPGKVIDEIFKVLKFLKNCRSPPRAHEILQELRDISSMAMEHFDEKIAPGLKNNRYSEACSSNPYSSRSVISECICGTCANSSNSTSARSYFTQDKLRMEFQKSQRRDQKNRKELHALKNKMSQHKSRLNVQAKKLSSQAVLIAEQDTQIGEMKRTLAEWDHKYGDLVAELSCVREENTVLAAALGIVFNRNKSSQEVSIEQPCTSRGNEGIKRKFNDSGENVRLPKKSRLGKTSVETSQEEKSIVTDQILPVIDDIITSNSGNVPECL